MYVMLLYREDQLKARTVPYRKFKTDEEQFHPHKRSWKVREHHFKIQVPLATIEKV
jgi:hypothetical protein